MAERSEAVEEKAVRDGSAVHSVEAEIATKEDLPPGYKRTEVGVIPEDWAVEAIGSVFQPTAGGDHKPSRSSEEFRDEYRYPIYANAIQNQGLYGYASYETAKAGSITVTARGTLGHADFRKSPFVAIGRLLVLEPRQECEGFYFSEYINHGITFSVESTGVPQLTAPQVAKYPLPVPPLKEQRAIATALSDADALIESLGRLIAKKRAIKQAAMQELLTGQTRLPGFTGEWETKRLGDVGTFYKGQGIRRDDVSDEGVPCIRYGEIYTRYRDCVVMPESRIPEVVAEAAFPLRTGDIVFAGSGETAEEIGMCVAYLGEQPAFAGGDIVVLRPNEGVSGFLGRLLNHPTIAQQKARLGQGDAVVHISARNLAQVEVHLPQQKEQTAIATVLSGINAQIETLERRRGKARKIKQGMIQQLLTGRVRLV